MMTSPALVQAEDLIEIADQEGAKQDALLAIGYALISIAQSLEEINAKLDPVSAAAELQGRTLAGTGVTPEGF